VLGCQTVWLSAVAIWRRRFFLMRRPTILGMASRLEGFQALSQDPVVEVDVEVEMENDPLDIKPMMQEIEEYIILEEDPEMYAMAGMELVLVPAPVEFQNCSCQ
jgi:hypothetical protein